MLAAGKMNVEAYTCPSTIQAMLRNRMPCRQSNVLVDLLVFRSSLPFVYQEKTIRISLRFPCYHIGNNTYILMKLFPLGEFNKYKAKLDTSYLIMDKSRY
jgi:hypothetical protein